MHAPSITENYHSTEVGWNPQNGHLEKSAAMPANEPLRHLVRRSDLVAIRG
jgi:hypothetical protein